MAIYSGKHSAGLNKPKNQQALQNIKTRLIQICFFMVEASREEKQSDFKIRVKQLEPYLK